MYLCVDDRAKHLEVIIQSKNVKIPMELIEKLEKRNTGKPLGEVLLEIYNDYELIEKFVAVMAKHFDINMNKASVSDALSKTFHAEWDNRKKEWDDRKKAIEEMRNILIEICKKNGWTVPESKF